MQYEFAVEETYRQHRRRRRKKCPHCGSRKVEPMISAVHIKTATKS